MATARVQMQWVEVITTPSTTPKSRVYQQWVEVITSTPPNTRRRRIVKAKYRT